MESVAPSERPAKPGRRPRAARGRTYRADAVKRSHSLAWPGWVDRPWDQLIDALEASAREEGGLE